MCFICELNILIYEQIVEFGRTIPQHEHYDVLLAVACHKNLSILLQYMQVSELGNHLQS